MQFLATNDYAELPETDEKDEKVEREDRTEFEENHGGRWCCYNQRHF